MFFEICIIKTIINIEQINIPDIPNTTKSGGISIFFILIKIYEIIPIVHIVKTVGILHEAIGACSSSPPPPTISAWL